MAQAIEVRTAALCAEACLAIEAMTEALRSEALHTYP